MSTHSDILIRHCRVAGSVKSFANLVSGLVDATRKPAANLFAVATYDPRFAVPFTSGGGFSNYFPRPAYWDAAVKKYLTYVGGEYAGLYNASGRGIPDIAAQAQNFSTVWNGTVRPVDGTSATTPTAAAIFALVNDALIAVGRPPIDFLNVSANTVPEVKHLAIGHTDTLD